MEYLEGETLAQRLLKGSLPVQQVLQYAIEISDALDKAHRKGVTHRDLKPGNIMLTKSGAKLLDFGLAKLRQDAAPATPLSQLPTADDAITAQGTILGTLQYMAPEQLEAKEADARTDIFAFGAVVFEMATGKRAFEGKSSASIMAKILESNPPPISSLQPVTPPALDHVVRRCLAKDPDERWQSAKDICEQLRWISDSGPQAGVTAPLPEQKSKKNIVWAGAAVAIAVAVTGAAAFYLRRTPPPAGKQAIRFSVGPPEKGSFSGGPLGSSLSVSPDGTKLVFAADVGSSRSQLWIRSLNSPTAQALPGTENATYPFWSPDSRFVAFSADRKLKKIAVSGGPVETLAVVAPTMGTWSGEGVVLFIADDNSLSRVSESGGNATPVTTFDASRSETGHFSPQFLPDGKHFLYFARSSKAENNAIYVASLDSKEKKLLLNVASNPVYVPPRYLLFHRQGTLMAQPFDADRLNSRVKQFPSWKGLSLTRSVAWQIFPLPTMAYWPTVAEGEQFL